MRVRKTRQLRIIQDVLSRAGRPVSVNEILDAAQTQADGLGIATVYRTVKALVEQGAVVAVDLPGETPRYELSGKDHHHHFHCDACRGFFELDGCLPGVEHLAGPGFIVRSHEVVLYGTCADCSRRRRRRTR
jgi:Fur family ferric uptake transcriptional regulator